MRRAYKEKKRYLRDNGRCSFATPPEEGEEGVSPETKAAIDKLTADKEAPGAD